MLSVSQYIPVNKGQSVNISQQFNLSNPRSTHGLVSLEMPGMVLSGGGWEEEMRQSSDSHGAGEHIIMNKIPPFSVFRESTETSGSA